MRIGELARQTEVSVRAIRHYDALGLLTPGRSSNRYRTFDPEDVGRVRLIRLFLAVGFRLEEIRSYAPCWQAGGPAPSEPVSAADVRVMYEHKLAELDRRLAEIQDIRARVLTQLQSLPTP